jgi:hypothetical protein
MLREFSYSTYVCQNFQLYSTLENIYISNLCSRTRNVFFRCETFSTVFYFGVPKILRASRN